MLNNKLMRRAARSWLVFFLIAVCACAKHSKTEIIPPPVAPTPDRIEQELEKARSDLAVSKATEARVAAELEALRRSSTANPDDVKNYEIYLSRVQAMVAENQRMVAEMEKAYAKRRGTEKTGGVSQADVPEAGSLPATNVSDLDALDNRLKNSLSAFDQMLLKEMDEIRAKSERRMTALAQEAASAAGRIGGSGEESGATAKESASTEKGGEEGKGEAGAQASRESGQGESGGSYEQIPTTDGPVAGRTSTGGSASGQQAQRPTGSDQDDDIVARQLREAAEKETDPELKKKLWKEYEDYKKSTRQ